MKVCWQVCILQSLMKIFDESKAPRKEQLRRVIFWVMQLNFTHVRYSNYLNMNSLIVLQQSGSKLIVKIQLMTLRWKKKIVKEYALPFLIISIATFLVLVRNLSNWKFFVVMHCGSSILKIWLKFQANSFWNVGQRRLRKGWWLMNKTIIQVAMLKRLR